ncbi:MAG: ABC transporter permease subunit [Phycisphaeraceae bacterium]|nr:ABC transporter permease subunit [Phycisphaeraceae bacterium]
MWLMGAALALCVILIVGLVSLIAWQGIRAFWPRPIDLVTLRADHVLELRGERFFGIAVRDEPYEPLPRELERIEALGNARTLDLTAFHTDGRPLRRLYLVGNRDLGQESSLWVPLYELSLATARPRSALLVDRRDWGPWLGEAHALVLDEYLSHDVQLFDDPQSVETPFGPGSAHRFEGRNPQGEPIIVQRTTIDFEPDQASRILPPLIADAHRRQAEIRRIERESRFPIDRRLNRLDLRLRQAELDLQRAQNGRTRGLALPLWAGLLVSIVGCAWLIKRTLKLPVERRRGFLPQMTIRGAVLLAVLAAVVAVIEHPWAGPRITATSLEALRASVEEESRDLRMEAEQIDRLLMDLRHADQRFRAVILDPRTGAQAPQTTSDPREPLVLSQIVRLAAPNELSFAGKLRLYASRIAEFVAGEPRNANQEGGVFPVIIGTVTLTLLLTVAVVPLGVIAAIYLREYARQGLLTSAVRIGVNNLAGVPSIVYGVFGLGFFCYTLGRWVDAGPTDPLPRTEWWMLVVGVLLVIALAMGLGLLARASTRSSARTLGLFAGLCWITAVCIVIGIIATTPYFHGFFEAKAANNISTFRARGILWASLTLALLTLPVVIVATEEAIAAVPRSLREGSYGCGAGKWQTIRRIVLPGAMPGILTGAILAVSRGAGEVAPLMLVGAAKVAPQLPISGEFPFIHAERSFMHLGFHIFDLGFQSKDPVAARPLIWATTLLLILIVLALNMAAILLRARLRTRQSGF